MLFVVGKYLKFQITDQAFFCDLEFRIFYYWIINNMIISKNDFSM